ncbi:MAG: nucleotidyltransferase domain-containing protein [bacterium]
MRISSEVKTLLIKTAKKFFGDNCRVYIFGSRADDSKSGGDIDLFIETDQKVSFQAEIEFLVEAEKSITPRHIDLIVSSPGKKHRKIFETAKNTGVLLC